MGTYSKGGGSSKKAEPDHTDPRQVERDLNDEFVSESKSGRKAEPKKD